jgi:uncharacterized protein
MRIVFDIVHPAHVHFFKNMIRDLHGRGHTTTILARDKDVTSALLDHEGLPYETLGRPSRSGRFGQLKELVRRDLVLARLTHRFDADMIVTRNPAGVQAARLARAIGVFDTDDGSAAGVHFMAARPFAHWLTSPDCLPEDWGRRHVKYPGYKQSAYLHPDHFTPDPAVFDDLGLERGATFFVVRFVAMDASHDSGEAGLPLDAKRRLLEQLQTKGRVLLSIEGGKVPDEWKHLAYKLPPYRMHDLLGHATLVVGDSQTMAAEAAYLGTPALRSSTFAGRISYLEEMENRYGLTWAFHPRDTSRFFTKLDELLEDPAAIRAEIAEGRGRMLSEKVNIAKWFIDFLERVGPKR